MEKPDEKRRPVVVLSRDRAIPVLRRILVAPLTSRIRAIPTEVLLDSSDGLPQECAIALDNITVTEKALLVSKQASLSPSRMAEVCVALNKAVDCY